MNALKFNLIQREFLSTYSIEAGNIFVCDDTHEYFYDANDFVRMKSIKFEYRVDCSSLEDLKREIAHPSSNMIYITSDGGFFIYDDIAKYWSPVGYLEDIAHILGLFSKLNPATAYGYDNNGNKLNYAFKTLASAVYTKDGNTVQDMLDITMSSSSVFTDYVPVEVTGQTEFVIPYPSPYTKETFISQGNKFLVFVGSVLFDSRRYTISEDMSKIIIMDGSELLKDREVLFVFFARTKLLPSGVITSLDGNNLVNHSVKTIKLEQTSDSTILNNSNVVATSAAVYNVFQKLLAKIENIDPNRLVFAMTGGTGNEYTVNIDNYTLHDGAYMTLQLNAPILDNATLSVNGGAKIPIYKDFEHPIKKDDIDVDKINLYYNAEQNRFYLSAGLTHSLNHTTYVYTTDTDGIMYIDLYVTNPDTGKREYLFDFDPFVDNLIIYQDGIHLIEGVNYTFDIKTGRIAFLNYTLEKGTQITFEVQYIEQLRTASRQIKREEFINE